MLWKRVLCVFVTAVIGNSVCLAGKISSLTSTREAVVFGKSNEVSVIALLTSTSKHSKHHEALEAVADLWPDGGVAFASVVDPDASMLSRFDISDVSDLPTAILYRGFDDNGARRRGRKQTLRFSGDAFEFEELAAFVLANGVPAVVQYPNNDGPDYSARARAALQSPWPHLSVLGSAAELRGVFDVLGPVCASVKAKRPNFFCALFTANPDDDDRQLESLTSMIGIDGDEFDGDVVAAVVAPGMHPVRVEDAHAVLTAAAKQYASNDDDEVLLADFPDLFEIANSVASAAEDAPEVPLSRAAKRKPAKKKTKKNKKAKKGKKPKKSHSEL